jgi:NADPH:quinone reductase-like Zn-dependent oxidoreductase
MLNSRVIVTKFGGPEVLEVIDEMIPEPAQGEVRIKVFVAGVALADAMRREGVYPGTPHLAFTPGYDIVGVVEEVGNDVPPEWLGRKVASLMNGIGGYSRYICLPLHELIEVPHNVNPSEAVALVLNYVTAYQMLHRIAKIKPMDRILIHGAAGGVGSAFLELGKLANLFMFGTASTGKHAHIVKYNGIPIDYKTENFVERILGLFPNGIDAVFDPIGGPNWKKSFQTLNKAGVFVGFGFTNILSDNDIDDNKNALLDEWKLLSQTNRTPEGNAASLYSLTTLKQQNPAWFKADLTKMLQLLSNQRISPVISKSFLLNDVRSAHAFLKSSSSVGKIILICNEH